MITQRGDTSLQKLHLDLGGWPMVKVDWTADDFDLCDVMITMNSYDIHPLLSVYVGTDNRDSDHKILKVLYYKESDHRILKVLNYKEYHHRILKVLQRI